MKTPLLLIVFNRPEETFRVFEQIRKAQPEKLFIAADGPRENKIGENEKCQAVRTITDKIDWKCEVIRLFQDKNLGCKIAVSSALTWFFKNVEEGIILEDDCLPSPDFFTFCEDLLEKYRNNAKIMHISGANYQFGKKYGNASYYFSNYPHIWGWASWRRAWKHYDRDITHWPEFKAQGLLEQMFATPGEQTYWQNSFQWVYEGSLDTWDVSWTFTALTHGLLQVVPNVNLISNIGFGADATHTHVVGVHANLPTQAIEFPLQHPTVVLPNLEADRYIASDQLAPSFYTRQWRRIKRILRVA